MPFSYHSTALPELTALSTIVFSTSISTPIFGLPPRGVIAGASRARALPADDGLRLNDDEDVVSARPGASGERPEDAIHGVQWGPRPFPLEHGDRLSQVEDLHGSFAAAADETAESGRESKDRLNWSTKPPFIARRNSHEQTGRPEPQLPDFT